MFLAHSPSTFMVRNGWLKVWRKKKVASRSSSGHATYCVQTSADGGCILCVAEDTSSFNALCAGEWVRNLLGRNLLGLIVRWACHRLCHKSDQSLFVAPRIFSVLLQWVCTHIRLGHMCFVYGMCRICSTYPTQLRSSNLPTTFLSAYCCSLRKKEWTQE